MQENWTCKNFEGGDKLEPLVINWILKIVDERKIVSFDIILSGQSHLADE